MQARTFVKRTLLLAAVSVLLQTAGLVFGAYLAGRVGAKALGLFHLVLSVDGFAATVAISGARFAAVRLVSEEMGAGRPGGAGRILRRAILYAAACGVFACALLLLTADPAASRLLRDPSAAPALRLLALSLPPVSVGAVLIGSLTALGRVGCACAARLGEMAARILVTVWALSRERIGTVTALSAGCAAGDTAAFLIAAVLTRPVLRTLRGGRETGRLWSRLFSVACPLAVSAYARMALGMAEHLLIPRGLERSGASAGAALAAYGVIQGMALPVVTFPAALFSAASEISVPALTGDQAAGRGDSAARTANRLLRACTVFSLGTAALFWRLGDGLGLALYGSGEAGRFIRALAALMPLMYLDTVTDGMLRGLGQHLWSMYVNVADSVLRIGLVLLLLPRMGAGGYLLLLYVSEAVNFALSLGRLARTARLRFPAREIRNALFAALAASGADLLAEILPSPPGIWLRTAAFAACYGGALLLLGEIPAGLLQGRRKDDTIAVQDPAWIRNARE